MRRVYTTSLHIAPEVAEYIYYQELYNLCARHNVRLTESTYVKSYSIIDNSFYGMPIALNTIIIVDYWNSESDY